MEYSIYEIYGRMKPNNWTLGAIMCYKRKFRCKDCYIYKTYPTLRNRCYMKYAVFDLIKNIGLPRSMPRSIPIITPDIDSN